MVRQILSKEVKAERRLIYKSNFIEKNFNKDVKAYNKYMTDIVLQNYYKKKLENIDINIDINKHKSMGRPKKPKLNIEEIKTLLRNNKIAEAIEILNNIKQKKII